jgi:hypothetical protein
VYKALRSKQKITPELNAHLVDQITKVPLPVRA